MPDEVVEVAQTIGSLEQLRLAGVMTHLASADADDPALALDQVAAFDHCVQALREAGIEVPMQHLANSAATFRFPELHRDMVRVGIAMYGLVPDPDVPLPAPMKPVMTIHGRVRRVFDLASGDAVGYGGTYCRLAANGRPWSRLATPTATAARFPLAAGWRFRGNERT